MVNDNEFREFEEKRKQERIKYLQNKKPEDRYIIQDIGYGFIVLDKFKHKYNADEPYDYLIRSESMMTGRENDRYLGLEDFNNLLNNLDRQVNSGLYEDNLEFFLSKDIVYDKLFSQIDGILNNLDERNNDTFKVTYFDYLKEMDSCHHISIQGNVFRDLLSEFGYNNGSLYDNKIFLQIVKTINRKLDEYKDNDDTISFDVVSELKDDILRSVWRV